MKVHEAYTTLGLDPFGSFLQASQGDRRTGATTWMTVEAALHVIDGGAAVIVGERLDLSAEMARDSLSYIFKLNPHAGMARRPLGAKRYHDISGGRLYWESERTLQKFLAMPGKPRGIKVFRDIDYQIRAVQRREGPFAEIRKLVEQADMTFQAFDAGGEYLMLVDAEGVEQLTGADPYRIEVVSF